MTQKKRLESKIRRGDIAEIELCSEKAKRDYRPKTRMKKYRNTMRPILAKLLQEERHRSVAVQKILNLCTEIYSRKKEPPPDSVISRLLSTLEEADCDYKWGLSEEVRFLKNLVRVHLDAVADAKNGEDGSF